MKKIILFIILILVLAGIAYATGGVSGVANPAAVNSVTTPDSVCGVSGLAAAASGETIYMGPSGPVVVQSSGATPTVYFAGSLYIAHDN